VRLPKRQFVSFARRHVLTDGVADAMNAKMD